jgi:peptidoglycan/xylan/chitin deacetylase (PgdA/CDA1 family)
MRHGRYATLLLLLSLVSGAAFAAGPSAVGVPDRSLWPQALDNPAAFDRASRAEILSFAHVLATSERMDDAAMSAALHLHRVDRGSVDRLRARWWERLQRNYRLAAAQCGDREPFCVRADDMPQFRRAALAFDHAPEPSYARWFDDAQHFHQIYLDELLRLAALFPRVNSEIDPFSAQESIDGNLVDRQFLLSLDDGPTRVGGTTDTLLATLRARGVHPQIFALGERLQARIKASSADATAGLYAGMCVGAHGWTHTSHSHRADWKTSIENTLDLIRHTMPDSYVGLFRPPYGQRPVDSGPYFKAHGVGVMLWNIDSQDWNAKISSEQARQRVLSLMLLWRHGVILFHDIHPKANKAIPWLLDQTADAGVQWMDCHTVPFTLHP